MNDKSKQYFKELENSERHLVGELTLLTFATQERLKIIKSKQYFKELEDSEKQLLRKLTLQIFEAKDRLNIIKYLLHSEY